MIGNLILAAAVFAMGAIANAATPRDDLLARSAPKAHPAPAEVATRIPGVKGVMLEGEPYRGRPTRIFAWYCLPDGAGSARKCPAVVLIHGGMGTALDWWVKMWNELGYAAIAMDTCGSMPIRIPKNEIKERSQVWRRHENSGPAGWGGFGQIDEPSKDQWTYHAVSATIPPESAVMTGQMSQPGRVEVALERRFSRVRDSLTGETVADDADRF